MTYIHIHTYAQANNSSKSADFEPEALRLYELQKLKYYFAVVECSTKAAAANVYKEVSSSNTVVLYMINIANNSDC
jgi:SepF-like predicted cell division protein (DUF552 family)